MLGFFTSREPNESLERFRDFPAESSERGLPFFIAPDRFSMTTQPETAIERRRRRKEKKATFFIKFQLEPRARKLRKL
jgi:hypothetical protein